MITCISFFDLQGFYYVKSGYLLADQLSRIDYSNSAMDLAIVEIDLEATHSG